MKTFGDDLAFLKQHTDFVVLTDSAGQTKIAVSPRLQGRILTSAAAGDSGLSFGWINRQLIASKKIEPHINAYGGEDRFWLGPEGGQFSVFFKKGAPFDLDHWVTPAPVDTEVFELVHKTSSRAQLKKNIRLVNYSGTIFDLRVDREVALPVMSFPCLPGRRPGKIGSSMSGFLLPARASTKESGFPFAPRLRRGERE